MGSGRVEGRKLQLTGGSTYVVSLPKHWVVDAGLKAGDTVFLETEPEGSVSMKTVSPAFRPASTTQCFGRDTTYVDPPVS